MPRKKGDTVGLCFAGNSKKCKLCDYEVNSTTGIKLHLKSKHGILESGVSNCFCCFSCGKDFCNRGKLLNHLRKEHY